jgi:hypothetical protein
LISVRGGEIGICWVIALIVSAPGLGQDWDRERSHDRSVELTAFIHPDRLYWRPFDVQGVQPAEFKLLSFDEETGARSVLARLPAGWKQANGYHSSDLEMFVVDGGVTIGAASPGRYAYAYYPAGSAHSYGTEFGATVLQMWSGEPDFIATNEPPSKPASGATVEWWRYGDMGSMSPMEFPRFRDEPFQADSPIRMKLLRHDEDTAEKTWVTVIPGGGPSMYGEGHLPLWSSNSGWTEGFLLAGETTTAECLPQGEVAGTYSANGYYFRPAGMRHGGPSYYSNTYAVWLMRSGPGHWVTFHDSCEELSTRSEPKVTRP